MPSDPLTPVAGWDSVRMPLNTERGDAAELRSLAIQPLLNTTARLAQLTPGANQQGYIVRASLKGRTSVLGGIFAEVQDTTSHNVSWRQAINSDDYPLVINVTDLLPQEGKISAFGIYWYGGSGHSAMPQYRPSAHIYYRPFAEFETVEGQPFGVIGFGSIPDLSVYETPRPISAAIPTPATINVGYSYDIRVFGESGLNYQNGFTVTGVFVEVIR